MSEERPTAACCPEWEEHVSTIDDVLKLHQVRKGEVLDFEPFRFCPWCGSAQEECGGSRDFVESEPTNGTET